MWKFCKRTVNIKKNERTKDAQEWKKNRETEKKNWDSLSCLWKLFFFFASCFDDFPSVVLMNSSYLFLRAIIGTAIFNECGSSHNFQRNENFNATLDTNSLKMKVRLQKRNARLLDGYNYKLVHKYTLSTSTPSSFIHFFLHCYYFLCCIISG